MATQLTHPNENRIDSVQTKSPKPEDEYSSEFLARRWDNARAAMESAKGTDMYPRRQLEHEMAMLHYQLAVQRAAHEDAMRRNGEILEKVSHLEGVVHAWQAFAEMLPRRLEMLEGAYSSLTMMANAGAPTRKLIDAYEMGLQRGASRGLTEEGKPE